MNPVPLHSVPLPGRHKDEDPLILVNLDLVYCVARLNYYEAGDPVKEGSKLHLAVPSGYTLEVQETRVEILRLLEGPGKHSVCKCSATQNKNPRDTFP